MGTVRLVEKFTFSGGKVTREGAYPVIKDVLLCGAESANKRRYTAAAFAGGRVQKYNNRPVFLNHGKGRESRQYQDKVGTIENARLRADGMPIGDIAVNPKHPYAETFLHDAEHKASSCGMSHVAHCETKRAADGWDEITELVEAESVDVVVDPATTKSLFENRGDRSMAITLRKFLEAHRFKDATIQKHVRKAIVEMDDGSSAIPADMPMDEPADGADPDDALLTGFKAAIDAVWAQYTDDKDAPAAVAAIGKYIKAHAKLTTGKDEPEEKSGEEGDGEPDKESKKKEGKGKGAAPTKPALGVILTECDKAGHKVPSAKLLTALAEITDPTIRLGLIEDAKAAAKPADEPRSAGRTPGSGGVRRTTEQKSDPAVPTDKKKFLESITD